VLVEGTTLGFVPLLAAKALSIYKSARLSVVSI